MSGGPDRPRGGLLCGSILTGRLLVLGEGCQLALQVYDFALSLPLARACRAEMHFGTHRATNRGNPACRSFSFVCRKRPMPSHFAAVHADLDPVLAIVSVGVMLWSWRSLASSSRRISHMWWSGERLGTRSGSIPCQRVPHDARRASAARYFRWAAGWGSLRKGRLCSRPLGFRQLRTCRRTRPGQLCARKRLAH